jgi:hypothetical protein
VTPDELDALIQQHVDDAPPLDDATRERLRYLLNPPSDTPAEQDG